MVNIEGLHSAGEGRITRRTLAGLVLAAPAPAANTAVAYGQTTIPAGIRSRFADGINGLRVHFLEAGSAAPSRPCALLLHGFPELAYSWRKIMLPLAEAGFHVVAPDLRGYGRTTGWDSNYDTDLQAFSFLNMVRDQLGLLSALGYKSAHVIGRDAGSPLAGWCALIRPDIFRTVAMMTAPFTGAPDLSPAPAPSRDLDAQLAALPRPRKYYQRYYATREAEPEMLHAPQGLHAFFRAYFHYKSADWPGNQPSPLRANSAEEMARMPTYYVMDRNKGMCETALEYMPSPQQAAACQWLTDAEVEVYASEYARTGFQAALNLYRRGSQPALTAQLQIFAGKNIDVPSCFIAGKHDWGPFQNYGALERMQSVCRNLDGPHFIEKAGHWVQEEQPGKTLEVLLAFLGKHR
ncbi:MAG: alpha/beta hydrolase [Bryobacterales bacterium]|nr:alpha/beta hydrolase [Bryobacterales bacterium]